MGRLYIYLHEWLIFKVNAGKHTNPHGCQKGSKRGVETLYQSSGKCREINHQSHGMGHVKVHDQVALTDRVTPGLTTRGIDNGPFGHSFSPNVDENTNMTCIS